MPYSSIKELPDSIKKLPKKAQKLFLEAFNKAYAKHKDDVTAFKIAWAVVKKKFVKKDGVWVARTDANPEMTFYEFALEKGEEFITRTEDGAVIQEYILTDLLPDLVGTRPAPEVLEEWASWINQEQPSVDVDHELFEQVKQKYYGNLSLIERAMKFKRGIAKAVKAFVDNGKLIVKIMFDKRYNKFLDRIKGLSIEAVGDVDPETKVIRKGKLLGFTLAVNQNPLNPRAVRVKR